MLMSAADVRVFYADTFCWESKNIGVACYSIGCLSRQGGGPRLAKVRKAEGFPNLRDSLAAEGFPKLFRWFSEIFLRLFRHFFVTIKFGNCSNLRGFPEFLAAEYSRDFRINLEDQRLAEVSYFLGNQSIFRKLIKNNLRLIFVRVSRIFGCRTFEGFQSRSRIFRVP